MSKQFNLNPWQTENLYFSNERKKKINKRDEKDKKKIVIV